MSAADAMVDEVMSMLAVEIGSVPARRMVEHVVTLLQDEEFVGAMRAQFLAFMKYLVDHPEQTREWLIEAGLLMYEGEQGGGTSLVWAK